MLVYILSIRSLGSLFVDKSEIVQINQWQEIVDNNDIKVVTKTKKVSNSAEINSWENILQETGNQESEIVENSDEEYEEIIFQDNFDKEYRSGTEDNYLED